MKTTRIAERDAKQGRKGLPVLAVLVVGLAIAGVSALFFIIAWSAG